MSKTSRWTKEEIELLKEKWRDVGRRCVHLFPRRTPEAVRAKSKELKIIWKGARHRSTPIQWTPEMDVMIREAYLSPKRNAIKVCSLTLGIEDYSIRKRAIKIGCKYRFKCVRWSAEEDEIVQEFNERGNQRIHIELKKKGYSRSLNAIDSRRIILCGNGEYDPDFMNGSQLARLLGVTSTVIYRWVESGKLKARKVNGNFTVDQSKDARFWQITRKDFKVFVKKYPMLINLKKVDQPWFMELVLGYHVRNFDDD